MQAPFFYDVTLRDANQALKKPWNKDEKSIIFNHLLEIGVQGIEVGFPAASQMDFEASKFLAEKSPSNIVIATLARTTQNDIQKAFEAVEPAKNKRIHLFLTMSPFNMKYVLNKTAAEIEQLALESTAFARKLMGNDGEVQFSVEHFGDCAENLDWIISVLKKVINNGANIINLANTVERYRVKNFTQMVEKVRTSIDKDIRLGVHCHNDLGMATSTTVESYFCGATHLECAINGLGERAGNTNLFDVAVVLQNSGIDVGLNFSKFYDTSLITSELAKVSIYEKAPLIGQDAFSHRSGIHQDGAIKTKNMEKGAYRPINPDIIGRENAEKLEFTSQSGKNAIIEIVKKAGYPITLQESSIIAPLAKKMAEIKGLLPSADIINLYFEYVCNIKGVFELISYKLLANGDFDLEFNIRNEYKNVIGRGNGPLDACIDALKKAGFDRKLSHYEQYALDEDISGSGARAMSIIHLAGKNNTNIIGRAIDQNTATANVKAIFNALNQVYK